MNVRRLLAGSIVATAIVLMAVTPALATLLPADSQSVLARSGTGLPITLTAPDPLASPVTFDVVSGPSHGGLDLTTGSMTCDGNKCSATVTYTSAGGYDGPDSFNFTITDGTPETSPSGTVSITVDGTPPTVQTFTTAVTSPTNDTSIDYTLAFDEPVTGIAAGDFTNAGTAAGCGFAPSAASGTSITVTVTGCGTTGSLVPELKANSVADVAGNPGPTAASDATPSLTLDRVAPTVQTFDLQAGSDSGRLTTDHLTNASSLVYDLVVSEPVSGLVAGDFTVTGPTGCSVGAPSGSGTTYAITVMGCSEGSLILSLKAGSAQDAAGNTGPASLTPAPTVTVDRTAPTLTLAAVTTSPTSSTSLTYSLSSAENLDCGTISTSAGVDFVFTNVSAIGPVTGTGSDTCTIPATSSVAGGTSGTSALAAAGTFSVADDAGNAQTTVGGSPANVTVDLTTPAVQALDLQAGSDSGRLSNDRLTNATSLVYDLVFNQSVTGLVSGDFARGGSATGCVVTPSGSGATYTVTLSGCTQGSVTLSLQAGSVVGVGTNTGPAAPSAAAAVTIDRTAPTLTLSAVTTSPSASKSLTYRLAAAENLDCSTVSSVIGVDFTMTNLSALGSVTGSGTHACSIPATSSIPPGASGTSTLARAATFSVADDAGNAQTGVAGSPASVSVVPADLPPVAHNDVGLKVLQNGEAVSLPVLANDTDPDAGTILLIKSFTAAGHGVVSIVGGGTGLRYTPNPAYVGSDSFTYTISDGTFSSTAAVLLNVVKAGTVTRLAGADRYATSAAISRASFAPGVPVAYIANGLGFADALSGAPVAGIRHGPVLLVPGTSIPASIAAELVRIKPASIVILGGTSVVSSAVATQLRTYTAGPVTRLAGADRYATSALISKSSFAPGVPVAYIASGLGFADALSGAPVAAIKGGPVLLLPAALIPASIKSELTRLKPGRIVILGGPSVVSAGVAASLTTYTSGTVSRLAGTDRYATSAAISRASFVAHVPVVYIASGLGFADALSGAPVAGIRHGPVLLVPGTSIPASIVAELIRLKPANIVILGGPSVVSSAVATQLSRYTTGP